MSMNLNSSAFHPNTEHAHVVLCSAVWEGMWHAAPSTDTLLENDRFFWFRLLEIAAQSLGVYTSREAQKGPYRDDASFTWDQIPSLHVTLGKGSVGV